MDVSCGPGLLTFDLLKLGFDSFATDISTEMTRFSRERLSGCFADAEKRVAQCVEGKLPFGDLAFDLITANGVFPYIADHGCYIEQLRPGGYFLVSSFNRLSLYTVRSILQEFKYIHRPSREILATIVRTIRTGVPSGTYLEGRENV